MHSISPTPVAWQPTPNNHLLDLAASSTLQSQHKLERLVGHGIYRRLFSLLRPEAQEEGLGLCRRRHLRSGTAGRSGPLGVSLASVSFVVFFFFFLPSLALECGHGGVQWYPGPRPSFTAAWISSTQPQAAKTWKPIAATEHLVKTTRHLVHIKPLPDSCAPPPSSMPQTQTSRIRKHLQRSIHNGASASP